MKENFEKLLGKRAYAWALQDVQVEVVIENLKERWGKLRFFVRPVAGKGGCWVEQVSLIEE